MSQVLNDTVKVEIWVLCLVDSDNGEPLFYYNAVKDTFDREFTATCGFLIEKECNLKQIELNIEGLQKYKGTMDVPTNILIDSIMEVFVETGLVKKD